jgi:hypothetical protein
MLIEMVSGIPFETYTTTEVLEPLGMKSAAFTSLPEPEPLTAKGYRARKVEPDIFYDSHLAGGLRGSSLDASAFVRLILAAGATPAGRLLSAGTLREMLRQQNVGVAMDFDLRIGLGFRLEEVGGYRAVGHNGDIRRRHSALLAVSGEKSGVYVASNSSELRQSVDRVARRALALAPKAKTGKPIPKSSSDTRESTSLAASGVEELPDFSATELGLTTVTARNGEVSSHLKGSDLKLVPRPQHRFAIQLRLLGLVSVRVPSPDTLGLAFPRVDGRSLVVAYVGGNAVVLGERVSPVPIPEAWSKRASSWKAANTDGVGDILRGVRIREEGEFVVFETDRREIGASARPLTPIGDREALTSGTRRGMGELRLRAHGSAACGGPRESPELAASPR